MRALLISLQILVLTLGFTACQSPSSPSQSPKPTVLVSLAPYAYVVKKLAADLVDIEILVPQGANPHIYEAPPKQVEKHQKAALWIYLGENFDKKMLQFFKEQASGIQTLDIAEGIDLLQDDCGCHHHASAPEGRDLHLWMSPELVLLQAKRITSALITLLPDKQSLLEENLTAFLEELSALQHTIAALLEPKKGSSILVSHPAFAYFCKEYGLNQLSIETEGKEPRPQDIDHLLVHAKELQITTIITEPQHSNKGAQAIAEHLGISTQMVDPYTEDYADNLLNLARLIAK